MYLLTTSFHTYYILFRILFKPCFKYFNHINTILSLNEHSNREMTLKRFLHTEIATSVHFVPHFWLNLKQGVSVDMMNDTSRDILKRYWPKWRLKSCPLQATSDKMLAVKPTHDLRIWSLATCDLWMSKLGGRPTSYCYTTSNFGPLNHYGPHLELPLSSKGLGLGIV